jgi:electron transfer flavoprotein beta subunit
VTTDLRLNEPRYVKLPDIMKAKKKLIETVPIQSLGVDTAPVLRVTRYETPPARSKGAMVKGVDELVSALRDRGLLA